MHPEPPEALYRKGSTHVSLHHSQQLRRALGDVDFSAGKDHLVDRALATGPTNTPCGHSERSFPSSTGACRRCCLRATARRAEFGEGSREPLPRIDVGGQFVVAATQVLNE